MRFPSNRVAATCMATALACAIAACPGTRADRQGASLTYTYIQGSVTPEIVTSMHLGSELPGVSIRPLAVPAEVLFREPYVLSLSTGSSAIDAYLLDAPWVKSYSATRWLAPIEGADTEFELSNFRAELLDVTSTGAGEERQVLAIPFDTKGNILFYRKDLLESAGFGPPKTWAELFTQCLNILDSSEDENLEFGILFHGIAFINDFYPIMWSFGGGIFDDDGNLIVNCPENVRALAMIKKMLGIISPNFDDMNYYGFFDDYSAVDILFAQGRAVFMINWNTRWQDLISGFPGQVIGIDQVGVAPIPSESDGPGYSNIGSFCWGINYYSRNRAEARKFIKLITSYESQRWAALNKGILPARLDVLEDPEIAERDPSVLRIAEVFNKVRLRARPYQREINEILDQFLVDAFQLDFDPYKTLTDAQEEISRELARVRQRAFDAGR